LYTKALLFNEGQQLNLSWIQHPFGQSRELWQCLPAQLVRRRCSVSYAIATS